MQTISSNRLEPIERASRDEIAALQTERLRATLRRAYDNVPAYRQKFDAAGVHPDDLKTLADLSKFPFTTKQDLRDNYPYGMFAVPMRDVVRIHASSGRLRRLPTCRCVRNSSRDQLPEHGLRPRFVPGILA